MGGGDCTVNPIIFFHRMRRTPNQFYHQINAATSSYVDCMNLKVVTLKGKHLTITTTHQQAKNLSANLIAQANTGVTLTAAHAQCVKYMTDQ
jgi:hypothetical protein